MAILQAKIGTALQRKQKNDALLKQYYLAMRKAKTPREMIRVRESFLKQGLKGSYLHLGAVTPQVEAQMKFSEKNAKFPNKRAEIRKGLNLAVSTFGRGIGNTSGAEGQARSRAKAQEVFAIQQAYTKAKGQQVQKVYESLEFQKIRQGGSQGGTVSTFEAYQDLLNKQGVTAPKYESLIINELAQVDIQGIKSTERNISNILEGQGITVPISIVYNTGTPQLKTGSGNDYVSGVLDGINSGLANDGSLLPSNFIESILPPEDIPEGSKGGILEFLTSPIGIILLVATGLIIFKVYKK